MATNLKINDVDLESRYIPKNAIIQSGSYGSFWSWGGNDYYALGLGDRTHRSSPTQVGALTEWKQVSAAYTCGFGIKKDGTLWAWGDNSSGQLGLGDTTRRSSPTQVGSLTNWAQISSTQYSTIAIKTDGTLWAWGDNFYGSLGLGDITNRSSPVQVGTLTNWKQVSANNGVLAVKTDGTLWAWGYGYYGQLGLGISGTAARISSPTQVGSLTNWSSVEIGQYHSLAIKTDGTLWAWGDNTRGQLGLGDITHRSSPTQIGTGNTWSDVSIGLLSAAASLAIKTN